jgi:hypothetical protein
MEDGLAARQPVEHVPWLLSFVLALGIIENYSLGIVRGWPRWCSPILSECDQHRVNEVFKNTWRQANLRA